MQAAEKLISTARAEIGYLEKSSAVQLASKTDNAGYANLTKYGAWFGWNGVSWCHIFVSWAAAQAGCASLIPRTASCYEGCDWFSSRGHFHRRTDGYTPQKGDIVYFSTGAYPAGGGHVGIVTDCKDGVVYTVEGNTSAAAGVVANGGGVAAKAYKLTYGSIYGYGNPDYGDEGEETEMAETKNLRIDGKDYAVSTIEKDGQNYVRLRDLQQAGYSVAYDKAKDLPALTAPGYRANVPQATAEITAAIATVQKRYGLANDTIDFMRRYQYGDDLLRKLAQGQALQ